MRNGSFEKELDLGSPVSPQSELHISLIDKDGAILNIFYFSHEFSIGRADDNDIVIPRLDISRHHLKIIPENARWWICDLNSVNGVYIKNRLLKDKELLDFPASVSLGVSGLSLRIQTTDQTQRNTSEEQERGKQLSASVAVRSAPSNGSRHKRTQEEIKTRLLQEREATDLGYYTRMLRNIIHEDRTHRSKSYKKIIWSLALLFLLACALAGYQQYALFKANTLALDMFYDIKTLEVSISQAEVRLADSARALEKTLKAVEKAKLEAERRKLEAEWDKIISEKNRIQEEREKLNTMKAKYQQYVQEARSWQLRFPRALRYEEELITRVARGIGESELELPNGFVKEVQKYIGYWQNTKRMPRAMDSFYQNNYAPIVFGALKKENLPVHFLYLPLQESNYNRLAIGPETRYGIAKGAWQFLASTAKEFGLAIGPLAASREYDELDERFDFVKASGAGARYLKHIYSTEAQASGLLVMAGYNYGHNRVKRLIRKMPNNPRERNFWKFIQKYDIPKETYDYVFYIFAAAVIGEDPGHFGFNFDAPTLTQ